MQEELRGNAVVRTTLFRCRSHWVQSLVEALRFHMQCVCLAFSHLPVFSALWTVALQAPLSMGFSRQKLLEEVVISSSWDLPGIFPRDRTCLSCIGR